MAYTGALQTTFAAVLIAASTACSGASGEVSSPSHQTPSRVSGLGAASCPDMAPRPGRASVRAVTCPVVVDARTLAYNYAHSSNCPRALPPSVPSARQVVLRFRTRGNCLRDLIEDMGH